MPRIRAFLLSIAIVLLILAKFNAYSAPNLSDSQFGLALAALVIALAGWLVDEYRRRHA